jgi:hypothetical protein
LSAAQFGGLPFAFSVSGHFPSLHIEQHTLKKADLLGDYIDRPFSRYRLCNWCAGINRF